MLDSSFPGLDSFADMPMTAGPTTDSEILAFLAQGDRAAATHRTLITYGPKILGFLWVIVRDEDAAQECFARFSERLWKGIKGYRGEGSFRTWCYQIAYNVARDYLTDPYRRRGRRLETEEISRLAAATRDATATYRKTAVKDQLAGLREELGPEDQTLLVLRIDQGMPWREVAQVMSDTDRPADVATLRKRFERLKTRLRQKLAKPPTDA